MNKENLKHRDSNEHRENSILYSTKNKKKENNKNLAAWFFHKTK